MKYRKLFTLQLRLCNSVYIYRNYNSKLFLFLAIFCFDAYKTSYTQKIENLENIGNYDTGLIYVSIFMIFGSNILHIYANKTGRQILHLALYFLFICKAYIYTLFYN